MAASSVTVSFVGNRREIALTHDLHLNLLLSVRVGDGGGRGAFFVRRQYKENERLSNRRRKAVASAIIGVSQNH